MIIVGVIASSFQQGGAPTLVSATIEDSTPTDIVMVFSAVITGTNLGFSISGTTSSSFASISGSGTNTITGTMASPAVAGETITISYDDVTGDYEGYEGTYQLAHFHPDYCFEGEAVSDPANYTNRSPYPMLHLLREASLEKALEHYEHPEQIPDNNIKSEIKVFQKLLKLSSGSWRRNFLFYFHISTACKL